MSLSLHPHIHGRLTAFDSRRARFRWLKSLAVAMIALLVSICVVALCDYWMAPSNLVRWSLTSSAYIVALLCFAITSPVGRMFSRRDPSAELVKSAEWLESKLPRLRHFLVAAVELGDGNASERNPHYSSSADFRDELQRRVAGSLAQIRTHEVLPWNTLRSWMISGATAASLLVLPLLLFPNSFISSFLLRALLPNANVARPAATMVYWVEPQTVQSTVPSNESIEISARVVGVRPENVFVSLTTEEKSTLLEMRRSAESTAGELYRAIIPVEDAALSLKILAGDGEPKVVKLQPTARPSIDEYQIEYQLPEYARSPNRTSVTDHGNLVALEGSVATVKMHATAPLSNISVVYRPSDNTETSDLPFTPFGNGFVSCTGTNRS
jgi:hypothetical protein